MFQAFLFQPHGEEGALARVSNHDR